MLINGNAVRLAELSWTRAGAAPLAQALAIGRVFENPRITVTIGNENVTIRRERNVRRAVECAFRGRLPTDRYFEQLLAEQSELHHQRTGRVHGPDVSLWIDANAMWNLEQAFAPRPQQLSIPIHYQHRIRFTSDGRPSRFFAALQYIEDAIAVHGHR